MYIYIVLSYYHKLMVSKVSSNPFNFTLSVLSLKRKRCEYFFSKCFFNKHWLGHLWSEAKRVMFVSSLNPKPTCFLGEVRGHDFDSTPSQQRKPNPPSSLHERHERNVAKWIHVSQFIQLRCMAKAVRPFMRPAEGFLCCISLTKIITLRKYKENQVYSSTVGHPLLSYPV